MNPSAPIGVFDSGVGGLSILRALRAELPQEHFVYLADSAHAPYGERGDSYVIDRTRAVTQRLLDEHGVKALVIACNTATAAAVHIVRQEHPELPLIGVEPALKPATALTRSKRIAVMATRGTLGSAKFAALHDSLKEQAEFVLLPCDGLADAIEQNDAGNVERLCALYLGQAGPFDTLVLGCTHYPFALEYLTPLAGDGVQIVETGEPVARQTRRLLEAQRLLNVQGAGSVTLLATGSLQALQSAAGRWLSI